MKKLFILITLLFALHKAAFCSGMYMGASIGTPGFINYNLGFYGDVFGASTSISFLHVLEALLENEDDGYSTNVEDDSGFSYSLFQLNLDAKLYDSDNTIFALSVAGGTFCIADKDKPESDISIFYVGPCVHLIWNGLFMELGAAYGKDFSAKLEEDKTNIIPLIQIGYMAMF